MYYPLPPTCGNPKLENNVNLNIIENRFPLTWLLQEMNQVGFLSYIKFTKTFRLPTANAIHENIFISV